MNKNEFNAVLDKYNAWLRYLGENGEEKQLTDSINRVSEILNGENEKITALCAAKTSDEPDSYEEIFAASDAKNLKAACDVVNYTDRLKGAVYGRFAGCTLGAPVEGWAIDGMKVYAEITGTPFPPTEYWRGVTNPEGIQYNGSKRKEFTPEFMDGVPTDDDVMYPLLNMMLVERYGRNFTTEDVGRHWLENMTVCCTAEYEALENLKKGVPASKCAEGNPYVEWIGAEIRADLFGYINPGDPVTASKMAYRDAYLTHRRTGIYGEMYIAAAIALAFTAPDIESALTEALKVLPAKCRLREDVVWAIGKSAEVKNYADARKFTDERFPDMFWVHTRNNTALIVFALLSCGGDFTKLISDTVAMGHDNDCTAATAGSIFGAFYGMEAIDKKWYDKFNGKIRCFLKNDKAFDFDDVIERITKLYENR
ncbi:MAG: ADP-ribosylglycohydrolase family protein [Christensenellales bacterium]